MEIILRLKALRWDLSEIINALELPGVVPAQMWMFKYIGTGLLDAKRSIWRICTSSGKQMAAHNPTQRADIRNRFGDVRVWGWWWGGGWGWRCSITWEGNHPARRNCGNNGVLEVAQALHLGQEFMSEDQVLQGTSPYIGTRTQGLVWRKLRDASMASSHQAPSVLRTQTRIDCKVRMSWWGPGVDWAAPFIKSLTELFLFLTWLPHRHKFIVKWIIERGQFEFSPKQLCLKDSFLRKKFLGFNIPF